MTSRICVLALVGLFVGCSKKPPQAHRLTLAGHGLGETWSDIGRALPCQTTPPEGIGPVASKYRYEHTFTEPLRWCAASDTVTLLFSADTLVEITVHLTKSRESPESRWRGTVSAILAPELGTPDSVDTEHNPRSWIDVGGSKFAESATPCKTCVPVAPITTLRASWSSSSTRPWNAEVYLSGSDSLLMPLRPELALAPSYEGLITLTACGRRGAPPCARVVP